MQIQLNFPLYCKGDIDRCLVTQTRVTEDTFYSNSTQLKELRQSTQYLLTADLFLRYSQNDD